MSDVKIKVRTAEQSGDVTDLPLLVPPMQAEVTNWQLQIVCTGTPSAGAVTLKAAASDADRYFTLVYSNGTDVSLTLTATDVVSISDFVLGGLKITMTGFATATAWHAILRGW